MAYQNRQPNDQFDRRLVEYDDKKRSLDLWRMNLVPPEVGIFDDPKRCYELNEEWARIVMGIVSWLADTPVWRDAENEGYSAIEQILEFMIGQPCMSFELRQNPSNTCLLEQSLDGGETWTTAFDYSLCHAPALASQSLNDSIDLLNQLLADFDGSVNSVAPDMVYDASPTDAIRDIALCHALAELVEIMCEAELEYRRQIALASNVTAVLLGLLGVIIAIATGGTATPFYLAVSASLAGGFGTIFGGLSTLILNDESAREAVTCCMVTALSGATITQIDFEQSLDACGFTGGSNESQLAGAIAQMLTQDDMYESFLDYMQRAYKLADLGIASCPCGIETTYYLELDATATQGNVTLTNATWDSGIGFRDIFSSSTSRCYVAYFLSTKANVSAVDMRFQRIPASSTGFRQLRLRDGSTTLINQTSTNGTAYPYPTTYAWSGSQNNVDRVEWRLNTSPENTDIIIDRLRVTITTDEGIADWLADGWTEYIP